MQSLFADQPPCSLSSEDDEPNVGSTDQMSLNRIFKELKTTQTNILENRTENQSMYQQIKNLTQKIAQFKALVVSVRMPFSFEEVKSCTLLSFFREDQR